MLNGKIDVEFVPLADFGPVPLEPDQGILSEEELGFCRALKTSKRRRDWLAGRLAAKRLVRRRLGREGSAPPLHRIEVLNRATGEPYVRVDGATLPVSISHSRRWAVAAVSDSAPAAPALPESRRGRSPFAPGPFSAGAVPGAIGAPGAGLDPGGRVGVDVETPEERADSWLELAAHPSERSAALRADPVRQTLLWTLKEAVLKVLGVGLSADLWDVRFVADEGGRPVQVLGRTRLELYGKAEAAWDALGRPEIDFESALLQDGSALSVARAPAADSIPKRRPGRSGRGQGVPPLPRSLAHSPARGSALDPAEARPLVGSRS